MKRMQVRIIMTLFIISYFQMNSAFAQTDCGRSSYYPAEIPRLKKGDFVVFHWDVFTDPEVHAQYFDYIKKFRICFTNGYRNFAGKDLKELHEAGCELFFYRWFNGYYEAAVDPSSEQFAYYKPFPKMVERFKHIHSHPEWLINPDQAFKGPLYPAYFYDYHNPEFRKYFIQWIQEDFVKTQYDGVYLDFTGGTALPAEIVNLWNEKYPEMTYDEAGILFLCKLRESIGDKKIFGYHAYLLPDGYYEILDYDATESHVATMVWGKEAEIYVEGEGMRKILDTYYRYWDGSGKSSIPTFLYDPSNGYFDISKRRREMARKHPKCNRV